MTQSSQGRKFSLLHVVVATAILLFLVAALVPVYARDRPYLRTQVLSNLKQIMISGRIYCADYDGFLPQYGHWEVVRPASGPWIKGDQMAWKAALMPYLRSEELFYFTGPFREKEGSRLMLVRGVTNGASCYGYVAEITPKWFGSEEGSLHLNPEDPPEGFLKELGVDRTQAPLLEDLAWTEPGWFGQVHTHRILDKSKPDHKVVGFMDGSVRSVPVLPGGS